jgi:tetratricopeptide (TPR) repeat protein
MTIGVAYRGLYGPGNGLAVDHLKRALDLRQAHLGPYHPDTLASMESLAEAYQLVGRDQEAIDLRQRRLESMKATLGPDHPETVAFMHNLAQAYKHAGQWDISVRLVEQLLDKRRTIYGPTHPDTLAAMHLLATNYMDMDRLEDSMALYAKVLDGLDSTYGPKHDSKIGPMLCFARACQRAEEFARADQLLREALEQISKQKDSLGQRNAKANALGWLALNLLLQERHVDAERIAREAIAIDQIEKYRHFYSMSVLGAALLGQKKYADAESLLLQGHGGMKQWKVGRPAADRRLLTDAGERVVHFYEVTGQAEKAREWRQKLLKDESKK